tara:strand:- start:145 stop:450 length:306 start_codon:yes stop_codon:yes gene_type:complete
MEQVDILIGIALQGAFVVGCTAVIGKLISSDQTRGVLLPLIALTLGIVATTSDLWLPVGISETIFKGVAIGGSATGLYTIRRDDKKAENAALAGEDIKYGV